MADAVWPVPPEDAQPFGEGPYGRRLDWNSAESDFFLAVELPFWLMVPSSPLRISVNGCRFDVEIRGDHYELHAEEFADSRRNCVYLGPDPNKVDEGIIKEIEQKRLPVIRRKCKTVLRIPTKGLSDALSALEDKSYWRMREALSYFQALAAAHIPMANAVIQRYRLATYDYFPFEVSPWDVPVWFVQAPGGHIMASLFPYAEWDYKPNVNDELYTLISGEDLQKSSVKPGPGEPDLLDGLMLMERGDYSGAVRRVTTAIEVLVEDRLRSELLKHHASQQVENRLLKSQNDFPGRLRQWSKLSDKPISKPQADELERTRELRHEIVHDGRRLSYMERGLAQRSVDTSRWMYNFIEGKPSRAKVREGRIALRSFGRFALNMPFNAEITKTGAVVYPLADLSDDAEGEW